VRTVTSKAFILCAALFLGVGAGAAPASFAPVSTTEAAVTVKVTPRTLEGATWEFDVVFDTHAQDLSDDLLKTAALIAADGTDIRPLDWKGAPPGGHHRAGVLRFKALDPVPAVVRLKIARPAESKPRVFQWKMK
jgi:hypothetical protein